MPAAAPGTDSHEPRATSQEPAPTRRSFLRCSVLAWTGFGTALIAMSHMALRFLFPRVLYEAPENFDALRKANYPELGKVYEDFKSSQGVWLVRLQENGQDRLVAVAAVCTHLGCTPDWLAAEQKFKCPCHGSGFQHDGTNVEGPAPRPLERYRISLAPGGSIIVDKSKRYRKELGQWNDRESYLLMSPET
ncbi:MAG TPA: ubiquinol-cytochrome c reductase iron-sulfur subunit [Planctomycetota bacterium]|jgi:cytochrome b6-f complex iron-sulfur subunit